MSEDNPKWQDSLPEELRDAPYIGAATDAKDAMAKLAHAAKIVGSSLRIPKEGDDAEKWTAFYDSVADVPGIARLPGDDDDAGLAKMLAKLGAPAEASAYQMPEVADFEWDESQAAELKAYAQQAGLTKKQFKQFATKIGEQALKDSSDADNAITESRKAVKAEWGDAYDERTGLIRGWMAKSEAPENLRELFEDGNLPKETMEWLYNTAKQFKGDVKPISRDESNAPSMTPEAAREAISALFANPAYMDSRDPRHRDLVKRMVDLQKLANPAKAA